MSLNATKAILDSKTKRKILTLTPEQRVEIITSKNEIEEGKFINHEQLNKEISTWLNIV